MTVSRPRHNAFSSGEISPLLHGRTDFQKYQTGARTMRGFLPLREGGATRAPGTIFRGFTRNNEPCRRIPFEFAENDALTLEFTDGIMRVWRYGALVEDSANPGTVYELATPYDADDLPNLDWVQSADVIFIVDGRQPVQKLSRYALDSWVIEPVDFDSGPFRVQNLDEGKTIQASGESGTITLTATGDVFDASHVGGLFHLKAEDYSEIPLWTGNTTVAVGQVMRYRENIYELVSGNTTGVNPPIHTEGTHFYNLGKGNGIVTALDVAFGFETDQTFDEENDAEGKQNGTRWKFLSDDSGTVRITAVTDANTATAEVIKRLPKPVVTDPTYRWSEGAWSQKFGYPAAIEIFNQRLVAAGTPTEPRTVWFSVIGDFFDFDPSTDADGSFAYAIAGSESQNSISWLKAGRRGIYIGALGEVYRGFSATAGQAIGPTTFDTDAESRDGASAVSPVAPYGYPVFVSKSGDRVFELRYSFEQDGGVPLELSSPSSHLGAAIFKDIVWQASPQRLAWARRGDGTLAVMVYDPHEDVLGWAVVPVADGFVEDFDVTASLTGGRDVLTLVVRREVDGQTVRMVEEQAMVYGVLTGSEPIENAVHLFAASVFTPETAQAVFSVPHLEGAEVMAWTDRGEHGPFVVGAAGTVTLPVAVTRATIGLFDDSHEFETLDLQAPARDGDARGRPKRLQSPIGVVIHKTAAGYIQSVERNFEQQPRTNHPVELVRLPVAADLVTAFSGTHRLHVPSGHCDEMSLRITPRGGAPLTVLSIIPTTEEAGP